MADRSVLYRIRAGLQGGFVSVADEVQLTGSHVGLLNGVNNVATGLARIDGTGVGAQIFRFTGAYSAQSSNITEWFGGRQLTRLRCTDDGGTTPVAFTLPGTTALNTAFDQLVTSGLAEILTFVVEYTGDTSHVNITPRAAPSPQIQGISNIIVRPGVAATIEVTRNSGVISDYVFTAIGLIGDTSSGVLDTIKLINPATAVWNANDGGTLPSTGVVKGNAYRVANAPADGSGRYGEVMQNDDWIVWQGETFTSWTAEPHQWFVLPAHDVRRISALETDFLSSITETPESERNQILRGANYADSVNEIRMKIYPTAGDYNATDLNTTGDIDEFTDATTQSGYLAIRLPGILSALQSVLPTLYVFSERSGVFTEVLNMQDDMSHQGDFATESDYLSNEAVNYVANDTWRIYVGSKLERFSTPQLDISFENLLPSVQQRFSSSSGSVDEQRLSTLESKMTTLFPLSPDVQALNEWAGVIGPARTVQSVDITPGYSLIADYRSSGTRYESSGVTYGTDTNVITYTGLGDNLYRSFGIKVGAPADQVLMWLVDGATKIPFIDMTAAGNFRINSYRNETTQGEPVRNQTHFLTRTSGDALLNTGGNISTFTIPNYPTGATVASRTMQVDTDIYIGGSDTLAGHLQSIDIPDTNIAQSRQTFDINVGLGPLYNNRSVRATIGYATRVVNDDMVIDFSLISAPSDIHIQMTNVAVFLNYTPAATTARVDNFIAFNDGGGDYTFTGENELLVTFQPHTFDSALAAVGAAIGATGSATQMNDIVVPNPGHSFDSIEVRDDVEFRTFSPDHYLIHSDVAHLLTRRATQWCYGLATLRSISELTITEAIDLTTPTADGKRITNVVTGTTAPTVTPEFIGQMYIDTSSKNVYIAVDTTGSGDWEQVNAI